MAESVSYDDVDYTTPKENYRAWLMETGCRHDLTTRAALPHGQIGFITTAELPILLATANDLVSGDKVVPQQIGELGEVAEPYVLGSTHDVLSIGRRCVEKGDASQWKSFLSTPPITNPDGRIVRLASRETVVPAWMTTS